MSNGISFFLFECYNKNYLVMYMYIEGFGEKQIKLYKIDGTNKIFEFNLKFYATFEISLYSLTNDKLQQSSLLGLTLFFQYS